MQGCSSEKLQTNQREKESICEEETVSTMPQKHQDNPKGGHSQQLPGEQKFNGKKLKRKKIATKNFKCRLCQERSAGRFTSMIVKSIRTKSVGQNTETSTEMRILASDWSQDRSSDIITGLLLLKTDHIAFILTFNLLSGADLRRSVRPATKNIAQNQR